MIIATRSRRWTARPAWRIPVAWPALRPSRVHVWRVSLDRQPEAIAEARAVLSADERARASRFFFERDRDRFVAGRAALRGILGRYLGVPPDRVELCPGHRGKPALAAHHGATALRFNLAHSDGLALCAVASGRDVGVDLERLRADFATDAVAEHFFSRAEILTLRTLSGERRIRAFFDCWTRKEAYIKARGDGLWLPLDRFEVSLAPGDPPALLATHDEPAEVARWALREVDAGPGFAAALAVEGRGWRLERWQWLEGLHSTSP
jgi:4'-phosphopantetheinyl transferase